MPPLLIAGIDHAREQRIDEFTPTPWRPAGPAAAARYGRFVWTTCVPYLVRAFGVGQMRRGGLGGSSMGGLATLAIARQFPGRIGRFIAMSPSVWWDDRVILSRLRRVGCHPRPRVWLDIGRREGARALTDTRALRDVLVWQTSALHYWEDPEGHHSEAHGRADCRTRSRGCTIVSPESIVPSPESEVALVGAATAPALSCAWERCRGGAAGARGHVPPAGGSRRPYPIEPFSAVTSMGMPSRWRRGRAAWSL